MFKRKPKLFITPFKHITNQYAFIAEVGIIINKQAYSTKLIISGVEYTMAGKELIYNELTKLKAKLITSIPYRGYKIELNSIFYPTIELNRADKKTLGKTYNLDRYIKKFSKPNEPLVHKRKSLIDFILRWRIRKNIKEYYAERGE